MDLVTRDGSTVAVRVRLAASEAGILPADPLGPVVESLADIPNDLERRMAPILEQLQAFTDAAERTAARPILTDDQVRHSLLPPLLAALNLSQAIIGAVLLVAMFATGMTLQWYRTPALICDPMTRTSRAVCYRFYGPPVTPEPPAPAAPPGHH